MLDELNRICLDSFVSELGIIFTEQGPDYIEAIMPVEGKLQPVGILHGGASMSLAESVASAGSYMLIDHQAYDAVGLQVSANHVGQVSTGILTARAIIIHRGKSTHVWDVKITSDDGRQICLSRVTIMIVKKLKAVDDRDK